MSNGPGGTVCLWTRPRSCAWEFYLRWLADRATRRDVTGTRKIGHRTWPLVGPAARAHASRDLRRCAGRVYADNAVGAGT